MKKSVIVLWAIACLLFISSISLFGEGNAAAGICGIIISVGLCFLGYRKYKKSIFAVVQGVSNEPSSNAPVLRQAADNISLPEYDFLRFKLAGVSFDNDDGTRRQSILRKIKFNDEPFAGEIEFSMTRYEFEGHDACAIYANGHQIGNVPSDIAPQITENYSRILGFSYVDVYGGRGGKYYGAEVILKLKK